MGYPMTWKRLINRNLLWGSYESWSNDPTKQLRQMVSGDARRLESDTRDERHIKLYASYAEISEEQVEKLFDAFFNGIEPRDEVYKDVP